MGEGLSFGSLQHVGRTGNFDKISVSSVSSCSSSVPIGWVLRFSAGRDAAAPRQVRTPAATPSPYEKTEPQELNFEQEQTERTEVRTGGLVGKPRMNANFKRRTR